jgi:hypothetical protein
VKQGDVEALKAAGQQGRNDLIPELEKLADAATGPNEPSRIWAKAALAKLGVKKFLDETVSELTTTNSALFGYHKNYYRMKVGMSEDMARRWATYETQEIAFNKLAYVSDPSTIKTVASFLYKTGHGLPKGDVVLPPPAYLAIATLRQMVKDAPEARETLTSENYEQIRTLWVKWWEKNKDKYP